MKKGVKETHTHSYLVQTFVIATAFRQIPRRLLTIDTSHSSVYSSFSRLHLFLLLVFKLLLLLLLLLSVTVSIIINQISHRAVQYLNYDDVDGVPSSSSSLSSLSLVFSLPLSIMTLGEVLLLCFFSLFFDTGIKKSGSGTGTAKVSATTRGTAWR